MAVSAEVRCGTYEPMDRHRVYLQNLARRKQLEKEAAAARDASKRGEEDLERGFQICFNGANRDVCPPKPAARPSSGQRILRVPGALPVPTPLLLDAAQEPWQPAGACAAPR